jgi:hypothetical protein
MKLITEHIEQKLEYFTEGKGVKSTFIEGIFMQSETKNRNGRIYPKGIMEKAVDKYIQDQVNKGRSVGELNHPDGPTINLDKVSHLITELKWDGDNVVGKAKLLDTPMGKIAEALIKGGVQLGVSSRGMGSLENKNGTKVVGPDFILTTVDIVQDPSAHDAYVNGIMEGVEWIYDEAHGVFTQQRIEQHRKIIESKKIDTDTSIKLFKDFLNSIGEK